MPTLNAPQTASFAVTAPGQYVVVVCSGPTDVMLVSWVGPGGISGQVTIRNTTAAGQDVGPFVDGTTVTFSALAGAPIYTPPGFGSATGATSANYKRNRALWKPPGVQANVPEGQGSSTVRILKFEAEAPFSRVRLWAMNRGPSGVDQIKFAVATTDQLAVDTANNAFLPQRGGSVINAPADSTNPNGWRVGTWGNALGQNALLGASSLSAGAAPVLSPILYPGSGFEYAGYRPGQPTLATPDVICSDWVRVRSINPTSTPANGIKRPLVLLALGRVAAGSPLTGVTIDAYNTWVTAAAQNANYSSWSGATPNAWDRLRVCAPSSGTDAIGTGTVTVPTGWVAPPSLATDTTINYFALEFDYDVPVRSFGFMGDSNVEGYAWADRAIASVSTPDKPYTSANLGMSTNRWVEFEATLHQFLKRGAPFTDLLIPSHSHNDLATVVGDALVPQNAGRNGTILEYDRQRERILRTIDMCDQLGIRVWLWTHFNGYHLTGAPEAETVIHLQWCRDLCASGRAVLVDVTSPTFQSENTGGTLLEDNIHFTTAGITRAMGIFITALRAEGGLS